MMKKIIITALTVLVLLNALSLTACALESSVGEYDYSQIFDELDSQTKELLDELGVNGRDFNDILDLSPRKIISLIIELIKGKWKEPVKTVGIVSCVCVMGSVINTLNINKLKNDSLFSFFEASVVMIMVVIPLASVLSSAVSAMKLMSGFMLSYIPIFTAVISASGMSLSAFSYNAVLLSFSQLCSKISTDLIIPCVFLLTLASVYSSVGTSVNTEDIISLIKKALTLVLSLIAGIFTGLLAIKSKIAIAADSVAVKGIKLISGSVIPIVGGALGDAFSSVLGSFALIKNTVGAFGIAAILIMVLPSVLSLLIWYFSLGICSVICSFTGNGTTSAVLKNIGSCVSMVNVVLLFFATVFIISTGIMLNLRS